MKPVWRKFNSFSGPWIKANSDCYKLPKEAEHIERAFWLVTCVESGKGPNPEDGGRFGTINMYDGCGVTAGLHQGIAVYPKQISDPDSNPLNDQGSLFEMINQMPSSIKLQALHDTYKEHKTYIAQDNKLRNYLTGKVIEGKVLRNMLTPLNGTVPRSGPHWEMACKWAILHNDIFSDSHTYQVQISFGLTHIAHFCESRRPQLNKRSINEAIYKGSIHEEPKAYGEKGAHDLAMCMFFSHAVNAPGIALQKLAKALKQCADDAQHPKFPKLLIQALGNCSYGRWDDDIVGGRYQRTRDAAMCIWSKDLFVGKEAVMPKDLPS